MVYIISKTTTVVQHSSSISLCYGTIDNKDIVLGYNPGSVTRMWRKYFLRLTAVAFTLGLGVNLPSPSRLEPHTAETPPCGVSH